MFDLCDFFRNCQINTGAVLWGSHKHFIHSLIYWMILSVAQDYFEPRATISEYKACKNMCAWPNLGYYTSTCTKVLGKTTKNLLGKGMSWPESSWKLPVYKPEAYCFRKCAQVLSLHSLNRHYHISTMRTLSITVRKLNMHIKFGRDSLYFDAFSSHNSTVMFLRNYTFYGNHGLLKIKISYM